MYMIVLFYKYTEINNPTALIAWHREFCTPRGIKGRIFIATEGINATLGGPDAAIEEYCTALSTRPEFKEQVIDFKYSAGDAHAFPRLKVVPKAQLVNFGVTIDLTTTPGGTHVTPTQAHELIKNNPGDLVVFDIRNSYETIVGTFTNAITPQIKYFRDLPRAIEEHADTLRNKRVLMCCTGGIRCEKGSAYLKQQNIAQEVYQLEGGIHRYLEQYPDGYFRGSNYVFDERVVLPSTNTIISTCARCATACNSMINCLNALCNKQFVVCDPCRITSGDCCSVPCDTLVAHAAVPVRAAQRAPVACSL